MLFLFFPHVIRDRKRGDEFELDHSGHSADGDGDHRDFFLYHAEKPAQGVAASGPQRRQGNGKPAADARGVADGAAVWKFISGDWTGKK